MYANKGFIVSNYNQFTGTNTSSDFGVIVTNSTSERGVVSFNNFNDIRIGTQTEQDNRGLYIKCNNYTNNLFAMCINPASFSYTNGLGDQGTGCNLTTQVRAGNTFNDACSNGSTRHIFSTIDFTYYSNGNLTNPNVGCISQKLKDNGGSSGDVIYCGIGADPISCTSIPFNSTDPEYLDSLHNRYAAETDPEQKVILKGQLLQNYLANDSTYNSAFAFLDTLPRDSFAMRALLPLYLQAQMPDSADAVLKMMTDSSLIDSKTLTIYGIALMLAYDSLKVFDISSAQEEYLREASGGNDEAAMIAQAILETVKGDVYERIPEEITEARLAEMQVDNKPSNDLNWIMASPNPFKETTQITFNVLDDAESAFVEVYNSLGQRVVIEHVKNSGKLTVNLKGMKAGVYQCHLIVNGALSASKKLILMD